MVSLPQTCPKCQAKLYHYGACACLPEQVLAAAFENAWQPITTAPKDGTEILVCACGNSWFVVFWDEEAQAPHHHWQTPDGIAYHDDLPSHWMPLPPIPADSKPLGVR